MKWWEPGQGSVNARQALPAGLHFRSPFVLKIRVEGRGALVPKILLIVLGFSYNMFSTKQSRNSIHHLV